MCIRDSTVPVDEPDAIVRLTPVAPACSLVIPVKAPDVARASGDRAEPVAVLIAIGVPLFRVSVIVN